MPELSNVVSGTMITVDKPLEWTSFDVVNKIRYAIRKTFQLKKIKVGHAGTLDPMASGLLIVCTGAMTKKIEEYQAQVKEYEGQMILGATTPTYDSEGEIDRTYPVDHLDTPGLLQQAKLMTGEIMQKPPIYSAIKKDGVPLYKLARKGEDVEISARSVTIYSFELTRIELPCIHFRVLCSKGTYIRSLVHDFGQAMSSGAYLKALKRTAIGEHRLEEAWSLPDLIAKINSLRST